MSEFYKSVGEDNWTNFGQHFTIYRLDDTPKIHVKFDDNQFSSFGDYMCNNNRQKQQTNDRRQINGHNRPFLYS